MTAHVTLGAQPRIGDLQQPVVDRAMRIVAVSTVFKRGRMLVKERTAPLGMASIAILVDTGLFELGGVG